MDNKKVDILFINPGDHKKTYQDLALEFSAVDVPVWPLLLSGALRREGYTCAIYDANTQGWDGIETVKEVINLYNPCVVVIMVCGNHPSASTQTMPAASRIASDLKNYNKEIPLAIGGTHPSALPRNTLEQENIDFVIQGEGLYTIRCLVNSLKGKVILKNVPGLWYREAGEIVKNEPASLVVDLDRDLPEYAWDLLEDINKYRAHNWHCFQYFNSSKSLNFSDVRSPCISLYTSLGCPYNCSFCCINALFGKPGMRHWSIENIVASIDVLVSRYKVKNIRLADELFIFPHQRLEKFCDMVIERGYDLNIWAYGRVDTIIDDKLLFKLKKAGVNWIALGIEAANPVVQKSVNKPIKNDIKRVVDMIKSSDINVIGNFMFGLPEDNIKTMEETLKLAMETNCEFVNFYATLAYPGSRLYQEVIKTPEVLPDSWSGFSHHGYNYKPLPTKYVTAKEVLAFRDEAFERYFTNPRYLSYIASHFGERVRSHMEKMNSIKLKRRLLEE